MENENKTIRMGLTPVRTGRVIASFIALMGAALLVLRQILASVLEMARGGLELGLARYENFTGRFAAQNFVEDRQLLNLLKEVQSSLPVAESALALLVAVGVILLVLGIVCWILPRELVRLLVKLRILKWADSSTDMEPVALSQALKNLGEIPLKKLAVPVAVILVVVLIFVAVFNGHKKIRETSVSNASEEVQAHALAYIDAQKKYFAQNKIIGGAKALQLADSFSTGSFKYKVTGSRFLAISKEDLSGCPAGSKWSVSATSKGVFSKELSLYRAAPKDSNCVKLTPEFKNLGRKKVTSASSK